VQRLAETIVQAFGYSGRHFLVVTAPAELVGLEAAAGVTVPATFALSPDKRTAVEFAVDHLARLGSVRPAEIALAAGSPYGEVVVDVRKCTLCLACAGACPEGALMDGGETPALRFLERNCVQCGLCERTCPEEAISLKARLLVGPAVRETRVLNEAQPFHCVSCGKAFGTRQMVDAMMGRLAGHSMFAGGDALRRLQMCADCRVVDMMSNKNEVSVLKL
jgi:ferredoxin